MWCFRGGGDNFEDDEDERNLKAETGALLLVGALGLSSNEDDDEDEDDDGHARRNDD